MEIPNDYNLMLWICKIETCDKIEMLPIIEAPADTEFTYSTLSAEDLYYVETANALLLPEERAKN